MKIDRLRVFQSVKVGSKEKTFLTADEFDMELKDTLIFITSKKDDSQVVTPLTNVPWFVPVIPRKVNSGQNKSKANTSRDRKKAATKA